MQTIASLAKRLDMSAQEAVEVLRKLRCPVEGIETEISVEQCDMLIEINDDASALDRFLKDFEKKEEAERKRKERLQENLNKGAAKRKAAAAKKPAAKKTAKKATASEAERGAETPEPIIVEVLVDEPAPVVETVEEPEEAPVETPVIVHEEAAEPAIEVTQIEEVEVPVEEPAAAPPVEEMVVETPEAPEAPAAPPAPTKFEAEILPPLELDGTEAVSNEGPKMPLGRLAQAEMREEEEERRRQAARTARPMPNPDPEVIAMVIRRDAEKKRQKMERPAGGPQVARFDGIMDRDRARTEGRTPRPAPAAPQSPPGPGGPPPASTGGTPAAKAQAKKKKKAERARFNEEILRRDAAAAVREFTAGGSALGSLRRKKKKNRQREDEGSMEREITGGVIEVEDTITVEKLAEAMGLGVSEIILALMDEEIMATKNQVLEMDLVRKIAEKYSFEVRTVIPEEEELLAEEPDDPADIVLRAPVITVMGHVDHGKTSFLDVVRTANVAAGEAGGITQHIAAYDVELPTGRVVFLDTPGHEAFTQMRARGSQVTDVVVLVVAADDGVRPQTIEAIDHAKAAGVPIVVAINKCDKPNATPDRVRQELTQYELLDEQWGGKTIMRNISAHTREGIPDLLEMLALESQMLELKANPNKRARGTVIESELSRGYGAVAWILVQNGTLRVGDIFLCGQTYGRVRVMQNAKGQSIQEAAPSTPVLVTGFSATPEAGDSFVIVQEERAARAVAEKRANLAKQRRGTAAKRMTLEDFQAQILAGAQKSLNIVIKTDVQGSADVLNTTFGRLGNQEVGVNIVHTGVGGVNESDVMLASASDAIIIGFHVTAPPKVQKLAEQEGVEIRPYLIIYEAIDDIKKALEGMLTPDVKETVVGHAEIRQVFRSSALGNIAGCSVLDGEIERNALCRLTRDGVVVYTGKINTLRRGKDDAKAVQQGFECGIKLERYEDIQAGDVIETYKLESVAKTL